MQKPPAPPSLEELYVAYAHTILTDSMPHAPRAQRWALRTLVRSAGGRPTAFTHDARKRLTTTTRRSHVPT